MKEKLLLGVDCGGTHTDAALLAVDDSTGRATLIGSAKTLTHHEDLPTSIREVLQELARTSSLDMTSIWRVTLGTTLAINALVQGKADKVGLALSAGPGLDPVHFVLGEDYCIVPGGLDHRGVEVAPLFTDVLKKDAAAWASSGVRAIACVGKFSTRNPAHEEAMGQTAAAASGLPITLGHSLSGRLNFPRRIATAYYNAAVSRLHHSFLDAVEKTFGDMGMAARLRLLKADGGSIPFQVSRKEPVQSILSGPAASVMGVLALWEKAARGCALLLDMGGTTTDIAIFLDGSPVMDREGMPLLGRRTLVRSLASISIGVGGDSLITANAGVISTGPQRVGPAMAFGGEKPTLLDALNLLDGNDNLERGDVNASRRGMAAFARANGFGEEQAEQLADMAIKDALQKISKAVYDLVENINSRPIYTLAALKAAREARPAMACLVGGPAQCIRKRLAEALGMSVDIAPNPQVANAIGAALTMPTASLEMYADTGAGTLIAPSINYSQSIPKNFTLDQARQKGCDLLKLQLASEGIDNARVEVVESDIFATLDDYGRGARDMRVTCQVRPDIAGHPENV